MGRKLSPAPGKRKTAIPSPPPRGARGAGGACARPGPQFPERRREAPGGPNCEPRRDRAHAGARRWPGWTGCGGAGREHARSRAGRPPEGTALPVRGGTRHPRSPTRGQQCVSLAPARGQDVRAGQRLGGGGGVGDSELVTQSAPGELLRPATLQLLQKGTLEILQVVAHSSRSPQVGRAERGEGTLLSFQDSRRPPAPQSGAGGGARPGRGQGRARIRVTEGGVGKVSPAAEAPCVLVGCAQRSR